MISCSTTNSYRSPCFIATTSVGVAFVVAGIFLLLAANQILPNGVNAISRLGVGGQVVGAGALLLPLPLVMVFTCCQKQTPQTPREKSEMEPPAAPKKDGTFIPANPTSVPKPTPIKTIKEGYKLLIEGRDIPALCGYNGYSPGYFDFLMPGIAVLATKLCQQEKVDNLFVCQNLQVLVAQLQKIEQNPVDQRHALIISTHSSLSSYGKPKSRAWEQHKLAIGIEKNEGHLHIYLLETMLRHRNDIISPDHIHLREGTSFTEQELVLAFIDTAQLEGATTSVYTPRIGREYGSGCTTFALYDALYFLQNPHFSAHIVVKEDPDLHLPQSQIPLKKIFALPPEFMLMTQSLSTLEEYQKNYPKIASLPFHGTTLEAAVEKHISTTAGRRQNHFIKRRNHEFHECLLALLESQDDTTIRYMIDQTYLSHQG